MDADCGVGFTGDVLPLWSELAPKPPLVTPATVADLVLFELAVVDENTVG